MVYYKNNEVEQSAWNLSQYLINSIGSLLQKASLHYREGRIESSFFNFQEIALLIHTDLVEDEDKKLEEWNAQIGKLWNYWKEYTKKYENERTSDNFKKMISYKNEHATQVRKYRLYVMSLLGKYGYLVSKKQDSSKMF